jgi:gamma-glutamyltranspeptidase/glutathione hydrolase
VTVQGAGFLLNNEMDDFASKPGSPNAFGLVQGEANAIAANKRMLSAMTPTIVVRDGRALMITGASGGPTIITGVYQVMSNVFDFGMAIDNAVRAPRVHQQHLPDLLLHERDGLGPEQIAALAALGHELMPARFNIAVAASLLFAGDGWTGAHDPRAMGAARGE